MVKMDTGGVNLTVLSLPIRLRNAHLAGNVFKQNRHILTSLCTSEKKIFLLLMVCRAPSVHSLQRWNWVTGAPTTPVSGQAERPVPWAGRGIHGILLWVWTPAQHLRFRRINTGSAELRSELRTDWGLAGLPGCGSHPSTFVVQILITKPWRSKPLLWGAK